MNSWQPLEYYALCSNKQFTQKRSFSENELNLGAFKKHNQSRHSEQNAFKSSTVSVDQGL